jgi:UDP-glucose 4-epimerase
MDSPSKFLVTGSEGFIGNNLCAHLVSNGANVVGFDILVGNDIMSLDALRDTMRRAKPDVVVHLAATANPTWSTSHIREDIEANVIGTTNVLQAAVESGVKKFVFSSTAQLYGFGYKIPIKEEYDPHPTSPYAISKLAAEYYCQWFTQRYELETCVFRFFNIYGPGQQLGFVVPDFFAKGKEGVIEILGNPENARDFIFIDDVVNAIGRICLKPYGTPRSFELLNLSTGQSTKIREIAEIIGGIYGAKIESQMPKKEFNMLVGDHERLSKAYGWEHHVSVDKGLREIAERLECQVPRQHQYFRPI